MAARPQPPSTSKGFKGIASHPSPETREEVQLPPSGFEQLKKNTEDRSDRSSNFALLGRPLRSRGSSRRGSPPGRRRGEASKPLLPTEGSGNEPQGPGLGNGEPQQSPRDLASTSRKEDRSDRSSDAGSSFPRVWTHPCAKAERAVGEELATMLSRSGAPLEPGRLR